MLDLTYLDENEPWSPGDLKIFDNLISHNVRFCLAVEELSKCMKEYDITLSAWTVNWFSELDRYRADWYVSFYSPRGTKEQPEALMEAVKLWRLFKTDVIFHLQRYSIQDQGERTIHRGHFVMTNKPEDFPQTSIKIL